MDSKQLLVTIVVAVASSAFTAVVISSSFARADGLPNTDSVPRLVSYQGTLESNGEPHTGPMDMRFDIYDGPTDTPSYSQSMTLTVFGGEFTALIGPTDDGGVVLEEIINNADDLRLGITLVGAAEDGSDVELVNRQRFLPTPYAYWATEAVDFVVNRDLQVNSSAVINGPHTVNGTARVNGDEQVSGTVSADEFVATAGSSGFEFPNNPFGGTGDDAFIRWVQDGEDEDSSLQIAVANDPNDDIQFIQSGTVQMRIEDGVNVAGDFSADANSRGVCEWTNFVSKATLTISPTCPNERYMAGISFQHDAGQNGTHEERVRLYCCEL